MFSSERPSMGSCFLLRATYYPLTVARPPCGLGDRHRYRSETADCLERVADVGEHAPDLAPQEDHGDDDGDRDRHDDQGVFDEGLALLALEASRQLALEHRGHRGQIATDDDVETIHFFLLLSRAFAR